MKEFLVRKVVVANADNAMYQAKAAGRGSAIFFTDEMNTRLRERMQMEQDLMRLAPQLVQLPEEEAALRAEHVIRNYDPCISCATHFLKLNVEGR